MIILISISASEHCNLFLFYSLPYLSIPSLHKQLFFIFIFIFLRDAGTQNYPLHGSTLQILLLQHWEQIYGETNNQTKENKKQKPQKK